MVRRRSNIDWYNVFLTAFSHDGAVDGSSDSPAPAPQAPATEPRNEYERRFGPGVQVDGDDGPHFRLKRRAPAKDAVGLGPDVDVDVPSASKGVDDFNPMDEDEQGEHVSPKHSSKSSPKFTEQKKNDDQADVGLGQDLPSASKGVYDFIPMGEDEQEEHVSLEQSSKSSPKKKKRGQLTLNKKKSQGGHGGKRKPSVNKRRARTTDSEESDYESSLPSGSTESYPLLQDEPSSVHSRKVQDVILLDDEDMEPKEEVDREMFDRLNEPKIYYPSRDDQEAVELTRPDIKCLDPENCLSSPVINFYIKYIKRTRLCNENFRDKFHIFNTYFFGKLEEALYEPRDFPNLRRWWKGVNIFNNAYIILPIHAKEHWSLVIICLPPKERISEPVILHLDSLGMHHSTKILNTVGRYLEKEWCFLSNAEPARPHLLSDIRMETVQVPQQNNAYDCGIFMLYYIEKFIKDAPARFTADKLDMFSYSWFKPEEASGLRQTIRELLRKEFECARLDQFCKDSREGVNGIGDAKSEALKKGKRPIASEWLERLKRAEQVMGSSTPIPVDAVIESRMKRSQGAEEDTGSSMPIRNRDAACEISGTKVWITRVYRPTSGTASERFRRNGGSSRDDRKAFIEQFCRKDSSPAPDVAAPAAEEEEEEEEETQDAVDQALGSRRDGRPIRKIKPNPKCFGPQWSQYSRRRREEGRK